MGADCSVAVTAREAVGRCLPVSVDAAGALRAEIRLSVFPAFHPRSSAERGACVLPLGQIDL